MKKSIRLIAIMMIAAFLLIMTSCSSEFGLISDSEKSATVNATSAKSGETAMAGGLEVAEGEQIVMNADMEKGTVKIEIFAGPEEQSIDEVPEPEGEPVMTFDATGSDSVSGGVDPGYYFIRATVTEKATGTVQIEVSPK